MVDERFSNDMFEAVCIYKQVDSRVVKLYLCDGRDPFVVQRLMRNVFGKMYVNMQMHISCFWVDIKFGNRLLYVRKRFIYEK